MSSNAPVIQPEAPSAVFDKNNILSQEFTKALIDTGGMYYRDYCQ